LLHVFEPNVSFPIHALDVQLEDMFLDLPGVLACRRTDLVEEPVGIGLVETRLAQRVVHRLEIGLDARTQPFHGKEVEYLVPTADQLRRPEFKNWLVDFFSKNTAP
jgi:hypothetical protein